MYGTGVGDVVTTAEYPGQRGVEHPRILVLNREVHDALVIGRGCVWYLI